MKKVVYLLMLCLFLMGCSSEGKSNVSMDSYIEAFKNEGIEVDSENIPLFGMIGAKDGITFSTDDKVVIYEFDAEKTIKTAEESLPAMKDWDRNGIFVLETSNEKAKEIFNSVK